MKTLSSIFCCKVWWKKVPQADFEVFIAIGLTVCLIDVAFITS